MTTASAVRSSHSGCTESGRPSRVFSIMSTRSERSLNMMGWASGSPTRALNSSTLGPWAVSMTPAYKTPVKGNPSLLSTARVGSMILPTISSYIFSSTAGVGDNAPMPPVLGPLSPASRRLWSWLEAMGRYFVPLATTLKLASSQVLTYSSTTHLLALPHASLYIMHDWSASD